MSDVGTQTEDNDDILSYKKQIEMLEKKVAEYQKQLNDLKNQTASNKFDTPLKNATITNEDKTLVGSSSKTKKGCSCKGSCSNSKCGCVKKGIFCDEFCKCITSKCSNQVIIFLFLVLKKQLTILFHKNFQTNLLFLL